MSRRRAFALVVSTIAFAWLLGGGASAERLDVLRRYEEALVQDALDKTGLVLDPMPEGKTIEHVVIVANKVILPGDFPLSRKIPWTWLNHLHTRTRDYVIARELLFHVGEPLRPDLLEESGRNLRQFFILSVARIVVARGSTPDKVVVLVVTKDQWTLRLNTNFQVEIRHASIHSPFPCPRATSRDATRPSLSNTRSIPAVTP